MKKITSIFIIFFNFVFLIPKVFADECSPPECLAKASIAVDINTSRVLFGQNINKSLPIASVTKIMTTYIAFESGDLDKIVTIKKESVGIEGSSIYLNENEKIKKRDLIYGVGLNSANDAAHALAIEVGGSIENFVKIMNTKAKQIGNDTFFVNPHGLTEKNHLCNKSSPYDLAMLVSLAMQNEDFKEMAATKSKTISRNGKNYTLVNHNRFLEMYEGANGVKTGYTDLARRCLVSSVKKGDGFVVFITLNDHRDWEDHKNAYNYIFKIFRWEKLLDSGEFLGKVKIENGCESDIELFSSEPLYFPLKEGEKVQITKKLDEKLSAPIFNRQKLGTISANVESEKGNEEVKIPVYSKNEVFLKNFWNELRGELKLNIEEIFKKWMTIN